MQFTNILGKVQNKSYPAANPSRDMGPLPPLHPNLCINTFLEVFLEEIKTFLSTKYT